MRSQVGWVDFTPLGFERLHSRRLVSAACQPRRCVGTWWTSTVLRDRATHRTPQLQAADSVQLSVDEQADLILSVDSALDRLESLEPRLAQVVNCRFFAGLSEEETARALDCSSRTVRRDWVKAQAMLQEILSE